VTISKSFVFWQRSRNKG